MCGFACDGCVSSSFFSFRNGSGWGDVWVYECKTVEDVVLQGRFSFLILAFGFSAPCM